MARSGWTIPSPQASMFAWAPLPEKYKNSGSLEFAKELMLNADVAVAPGVAFGEYGEGFVRIGLFLYNYQKYKQYFIYEY
jgi:alanine-synthesizing transaminase